MTTKEHHDTADEFNRIGDEHDVAFRPRVCKGAYKSCKQNVGQHKEQFEQRSHPGRRVKLGQEGYCCYEQGVISKRRKKLRRHNDVKTTVHSYNLVINTIKT